MHQLHGLRILQRFEKKKRKIETRKHRKYRFLAMEDTLDLVELTG